ncbi:MAG: hypothetical protein AAF799_19930 [Myxococcota bacterium]
MNGTRRTTSIKPLVALAGLCSLLAVGACGAESDDILLVDRDSTDPTMPPPQVHPCFDELSEFDGHLKPKSNQREPGTAGSIDPAQAGTASIRQDHRFELEPTGTTGTTGEHAATVYVDIDATTGPIAVMGSNSGNWSIQAFEGSTGLPLPITEQRSSDEPNLVALELPDDVQGEVQLEITGTEVGRGMVVAPQTGVGIYGYASDPSQLVAGQTVDYVLYPFAGEVVPGEAPAVAGTIIEADITTVDPTTGRETSLPVTVDTEGRAHVSVPVTAGFNDVLMNVRSEVDGQSFTVTPPFPSLVPERTLQGITGVQTSYDTADEELVFELGLDVTPGAAAPEALVGSATVEAMDSAGSWTPVVEISAMLVVDDGAAQMRMNPAWLDRAGFDPSEGITLRLSDLKLATTDAMSVPQVVEPESPTRFDPIPGTSFPSYTGSVTPEMKEGRRPQCLDYDGPIAHGVELVHGFCERPNTWPGPDADLEYPGDFTPDIQFWFDRPGGDDDGFFRVFDGFKGTWDGEEVPWATATSNDKFARALHKHAWFEEGLLSFSGVGHSQGGLALLHLWHFYWSGLDVDKQDDFKHGGNGFTVQMLATPIWGSTLADTGEVLDMFTGETLEGVTCMFNTVNDLKTSNAISNYLEHYAEPGNDAAYYGSFKNEKDADDGVFQKYCNPLTAFLMGFRLNDGVVKVSEVMGGTSWLGGESQGLCDDPEIPGQCYGVSEGAGQCHVTDRNFKFTNNPDPDGALPFNMTGPPQTFNDVRNNALYCSAAMLGDTLCWDPPKPTPGCHDEGCGYVEGYECAPAGWELQPNKHYNHPDGDFALDQHCFDHDYYAEVYDELVNEDDPDDTTLIPVERDLVCVRQGYPEYTSTVGICRICEGPEGKMWPGCECEFQDGNQDGQDDNEACGVGNPGLSCVASTTHRIDGLGGKCWPDAQPPEFECETDCRDIYGDYGYCYHGQDGGEAMCADWTGPLDGKECAWQGLAYDSDSDQCVPECGVDTQIQAEADAQCHARGYTANFYCDMPSKRCRV